MNRLLALLVIPILVIGCASKKTSEEARAALEEKWTPKVGTATKTDFVEYFGRPEWCRGEEGGGGETCRFYRKKGTVWIGDNKKDKKNYEAFDEVVADFDPTGKLKNYKANAQR